MKKNRVRLVKCAVSIAFFAFLIRFVGTRDLVSILKGIDRFYFSLSLLLAAGMVASSCLKWQVCMRLIDARVRFRRICGMYLIGYYFSNLLPSNIGGDVVRSYYLGRLLGSQSRAAASVFVERFSGILWLLALAVLAPLLRVSLFRSPYILLPALGAVALLAGFLVVAAIPDPVGVFRRLALAGLRRLPMPVRARGWLECRLDRVAAPIARVHEKIVQATRYARTDRSVLAGIVSLTVWFYLLTWLNVYLACRTFGARPAFLDVAAVTPAIMLVSMIPVSLGSLGLAEGAYVFYFSMIGMDPAVALAVGLFMRFKVLLVGVVGFGSYLSHRHEVDRRMVRTAADSLHGAS